MRCVGCGCLPEEEMYVKCRIINRDILGSIPPIATFASPYTFAHSLDFGFRLFCTFFPLPFPSSKSRSTASTSTSGSGVMTISSSDSGFVFETDFDFVAFEPFGFVDLRCWVKLNVGCCCSDQLRSHTLSSIPSDLIRSSPSDLFEEGIEVYGITHLYTDRTFG